MRPFLYFLWAALRNPLQVSTLFATGSTAADSLVDSIPRVANPRVVELGVGTGAITRAVLKRVSQPDHYIGIELNPDMIVFAKERFPQLRFFNDSAENFARYLNGEKVNAVVSSLPWTLMPQEVVNKTLQSIHESLLPGGVFATYLTVHVLLTPAGRRLQQQLNDYFVVEEPKLVLENLPPVKVFVARKKG